MKIKSKRFINIVVSRFTHLCLRVYGRLDLSEVMNAAVGAAIYCPLLLQVKYFMYLLIIMYSKMVIV